MKATIDPRSPTSGNARPEDFPEIYQTDDDIERGFELIASGDHSDLDVALEVLRMRLDSRVANGGGYPADIDLSHPSLVVVADVRGPDSNEPVASVYSRRKLERAGEGIGADVRGLAGECRVRDAAQDEPPGTSHIDWGDYIWSQVDFDHCLWRPEKETRG